MSTHMTKLDQRVQHHHDAAMVAFEDWEANGKGDIDHESHRDYERHLQAASSLVLIMNRFAGQFGQRHPPDQHS